MAGLWAPDLLDFEDDSEHILPMEGTMSHGLAQQVCPVPKRVGHGPHR